MTDYDQTPRRIVIVELPKAELAAWLQRKGWLEGVQRCPQDLRVLDFVLSTEGHTRSHVSFVVESEEFGAVGTQEVPPRVGVRFRRDG